MRQPEERFEVCTTDRTIIVRHDSGRMTAACLDDVSAIYAETNDSGPWGIDLWFVMLDANGRQVCYFPLGATNQQAAFDKFEQLPGFVMNGMNCTTDGWHPCWRRDAAVA